MRRKIITGLVSIVVLFGIAFLVAHMIKNQDKKETIEKLYEKGEILTKDEIADIVASYEEENESLGDIEIADKLEEDYNRMVAHMYLSGFMIDDTLSDEDNWQIMAWADINKRDFMGTLPVKRIVNPIEGRTNKKKENRFLRVSDLYTIDQDAINYFKDTEGFYKVGDLAIGYPILSQASLDDGELSAYLSMKILLEDNVQLKDLDAFFEKYEGIKINGKSLTEDLAVYRKRDDETFWNESFNKEDDYVFLENNMLEVRIKLPLTFLFEQEFPSFDEEHSHELKENDRKKYNQAMEAIFDQNSRKEEGENPVIDMNGIEIELSDKIRIDSEDTYEGDATIIPEVKSSE